MLETDRHMISREIPLPSPLYFKVIIKETRERSRICDAISQFLDDYAHAEEAFGKSLVKVRVIIAIGYIRIKLIVILMYEQAGSNSLTQSKQDWPNSTNGAWNNISIFTEKLGKQHIGYATCLSQSISRSFLEHSKISVAALGAIDVKVNRPKSR